MYIVLNFDHIRQLLVEINYLFGKRVFNVRKKKRIFVSIYQCVLALISLDILNHLILNMSELALQ